MFKFKKSMLLSCSKCQTNQVKTSTSSALLLTKFKDRTKFSSLFSNTFTPSDYHCEKCNNFGVVTIKTSFDFSETQYLVVRVTSDSGLMEPSQITEFDSSNVTIPSDISKSNFKVTSVVTYHILSEHVAHYMSYIRVANEWLCISDAVGTICQEFPTQSLYYMILKKKID
jgi:hypothetical protein